MLSNLHVVSITATCGRHTCLERSVKFFIDQDYTGPHTLLIYNNSDKELVLDNIELPDNKKILLINKNHSSETGLAYTNLGQIYRDILEFIPTSVDIITHQDDDDIFLPNHISKGVEGLTEGLDNGFVAYKPMYSYYRHPDGVTKMKNTLEPSIFVIREHIDTYKYSDATTEQHLQWVNPLVYGKLIYEKENGESTLIYNWGDGDKIPTYKTSGDYLNPLNFALCREFSKDHGDGIITPIDDFEAQKYYECIPK